VIAAARADSDWLRAALGLAERARFSSYPNPHVGCIVVRDGRVVGRGWTQPGGRPHAEAMALEQAGEAARGATAYATLEPCAHRSERGPACADLLVEAGVARVVIAMRDPDPRTDGRGADLLRSAGIAVNVGVFESEARRSLAGFVMRRTVGRPCLTLKLAISLDGRIAMPDGASKWITGPEARAHVHVERARHDAILVGGATWRQDAPRLDVRLAGVENRSPRPVVLSRTETPEGVTTIRSPDEIVGLEADWLFVEGGAQTAAAFLRTGLVDRLLLYRAPILIGDGRPALGDIGLGDLADAHGRWVLEDTRMLGSDRLESYWRSDLFETARAA